MESMLCRFPAVIAYQQIVAEAKRRRGRQSEGKVCRWLPKKVLCTLNHELISAGYRSAEKKPERAGASSSEATR